MALAPVAPRAYLAHEDPQLAVVPGFLSDAEVDHMLDVARELWQPSGVAPHHDSDSAQQASALDRTSYSAAFNWAHTPTIASIEERVAKLAGMTVDHIEQLTGVRYLPGQFFTLHHDGGERPKTVFLYLNDVPEDDGGETHFPALKLKIRPRKGCAVVWANSQEGRGTDWRLLHQALPTKTAAKYGVNCFMHKFPLRRDPAELAQGT